MRLGGHESLARLGLSCFYPHSLLAWLSKKRMGMKKTKQLTIGNQAERRAVVMQFVMNDIV